MASDLNDELCAFCDRWQLDGDWLRCRKCKRVCLASSAHMSFPHESTCRAASYYEPTPWLALRSLLVRIPEVPRG